jgi:hypothetical protein
MVRPHSVYVFAHRVRSPLSVAQDNLFIEFSNLEMDYTYLILLTVILILQRFIVRYLYNTYGIGIDQLTPDAKLSG